MNAWLVGIWKAAAEAKAAIVAKMQAEAQAKSELTIPAHEKAAAQAKVVILDSIRQCKGTLHRELKVVGVWIPLIVMVSCIECAQETLRRASDVWVLVID